MYGKQMKPKKLGLSFNITHENRAPQERFVIFWSDDCLSDILDTN